MKIAITGANGQLGQEMASLLSLQNEELVLWNHQQLSIENCEKVDQAFENSQPHLVINCASYNQVDRAEEEPEVAYSINAIGTKNLAMACEKHQIPFVHVSTNYVFGGQSDRNVPYRESDLPAPLSAYGISKLAGEYFALNYCSRAFVLRTAALFGKRSNSAKSNFIENMLRLGKERTELSIVSDQIITPTSTTDLAAAINDLCRTESFGLYHATCTGGTSWFEYATLFFEMAGIDVTLYSVTSEEFNAKANRPSYSVLDGRKLEQIRNCPFPSWQESLERYFAE